MKMCFPPFLVYTLVSHQFVFDGQVQPFKCITAVLVKCTSNVINDVQEIQSEEGISPNVNRILLSHAATSKC